MLEEKQSLWKQGDNAKYINWLNDLSKTLDESVSSELRDKFENTAVKNESVTDITPYLVPIVLNLLPSSGSLARAKMFDLLYSFGAGYSYFNEDVYYADEELELLCRQQVMYGVSQYFYYFEHGNVEEKMLLADLLELCSRGDQVVRDRTVWMLNQLICSEQNQDLLKKYQQVLSELV